MDGPDERSEILRRGGTFCELREYADIVHEHEDAAAAELLAEKPEENKNGKELEDARIMQALGELCEARGPEGPVRWMR